MSDEYIGEGGIQLLFNRFSSVGDVIESHISPNVYAILTFNRRENGVRILRSILNITISPHIQNVDQQSITCVNLGLSASNNISMQISGMFFYIIIYNSDSVQLQHFSWL